MNLQKKLIAYSAVLAVTLIAILIVYMVAFMPQLYMAHEEDTHIKNAEDLHLGYLKDKSYEHLSPRNEYANLSLRIPLNGNSFYMDTKFGQTHITTTNPDLTAFLNKLQRIAKDANDHPSDFQKKIDNKESLSSLLGTDFEAFGKEIMPQGIEATFTEFPYASEFDAKDFHKDVKRFGDDSLLFTGTMKKNDVNYLSIVAVTLRNDALYVTFSSVITNSINAVLYPVLQSLPTLLLLIGLIVFFASWLIGRNIVLPLTLLSNHAARLSTLSPKEWVPLPSDRKDELGTLTRRLNELHGQLKEHIERLEQDKARQDLFVRASSHQLKTPLASALLLTEGLIGQVGKYSDTQAHLPELRHILQSMQRMLDEMLHLRTQEDPKPVDIRQMAAHLFDKHHLLTDEKNLTVTIDGSGRLYTWPAVLEIIMDACITNAIRHCPAKSTVSFLAEKDGFTLENAGTLGVAPEYIFEPFVTGDDATGHGLGLYIAKNLADIIDAQIYIDAHDNRVIVRLERKEDQK